MINIILQGIVDTLYSLYGDAIPIYTSQQKQGFEAPCFFVEFVDSQLISELKGHYVRNLSFQISYITTFDEGDSVDYKDLYAQLAPLEMGLETLVLRNGDIIRGEDISGEIDEALHVHITYPDRFYIPKDKGVLMETLKQTQHVKED